MIQDFNIKCVENVYFALSSINIGRHMLPKEILKTSSLSKDVFALLLLVSWNEAGKCILFQQPPPHL